MPRVALTILLPLLAPTAIYFLWFFAFGRKPAAGSSSRLPWAWLAVAGVAAAALVLFTVGVDTGNGPNGQYVPPHVQGGTVVPGQIIPGQIVPPGQH